MNTASLMNQNPRSEYKSKIWPQLKQLTQQILKKSISMLPFNSNTHENHHETEMKVALIDQAARVAHDIRSPIATIEMTLHMLSHEMPHDKLVAMKTALQNVREITNNLLDKYRTQQQPPNTNKTLTTSQNQNDQSAILMHTVIEQVISQKHYEWSNKPYELILQIQPAAQTALIFASHNEISRMISNLLNNAIEACDCIAKIQVKIDIENDFLHVSIADNGKGIPPEKIGCYLTGESSKHIGRGIGLSGAKDYMESIGGKIMVNSSRGHGSTIVLAFRSCNVFT